MFAPIVMQDIASSIHDPFADYEVTDGHQPIPVAAGYPG